MQQLAYFESTPEHWTIDDLSGMPLFYRFEIRYCMRMRKNRDFSHSPKKYQICELYEYAH
jgi:hypothetical protein